MPQINVRVDEETKEKWNEAVERSDEYDSLTHLVELSVHHELNDYWILLSQVNAFADGIEFDTGDITSSINEVFDEVRQMRSQMGQIEAVAEVMQREELREIAIEATDHLPVVEDPSMLAGRGAPANESGHPADIRAAIDTDASKADVQLALNFISHQYNNVDKSEIDGEWRYYEIDRAQ